MPIDLERLVVPIVLDVAGLAKSISESQTKLKTFGEKATSGLAAVGGGLVAGVGVAVAGAGAFLASAIGPASDLSETVSKVGVVFAENSQQVMDWSQNSATALGMTQSEALAAAGTYGNLFQAMGLTTDSSTDMSTGLVDLAADLASFNNMEPGVVLDKLRAGLSGETEPLKTLGINLNVAAIKAKAVEMGLIGANDELNTAAKAQATYALIMEQTTLAQGDFARTSDGLANQQRILAAGFSDAKTQLGTALLPAVTAMTRSFTDMFKTADFQAFVSSTADQIGKLSVWIVKAIPKVVAAFQNMSEWLQNNKGVIVGVLAALGVAVGVFVYTTVIPAAIAMVVSLWPIMAVMAGIAAVVYLVYSAWTNNWGGIRDTLTEVWTGTLQPILQQVVTWLQVNVPIAIQALAGFWTSTLLPAIQSVWDFLSTNVFPLFAALADLLGAVLGLAITVLAGAFQNILLPMLQQLGAFINTTIMPAITKFANWLSDKLDPAINSIGNALKNMIGWVQKAAAAIRGLHLPSWLTPGSPTPFEMGLRGINDAMKGVNQTGLPSLNAAVNIGEGRAVGTSSGNSFPDDFDVRIARAVGYELKRVLG